MVQINCLYNDITSVLDISLMIECYILPQVNAILSCLEILKNRCPLVQNYSNISKSCAA